MSLISYEYFVKRKLDKDISGDGVIKTIAGNSKSEGVVSLKLRIFDITEIIKFFIVKSSSFNENVLLGLDCIKKFKLCQNEHLIISQNLDKKVNVVQNASALIDFSNFDSTPEVRRILDTYKDAFAISKFDVGLVNNMEARIKLTENKYVSKKPYKCSLQDQIEIESQIKELTNAGLIEESSSPYASRSP